MMVSEILIRRYDKAFDLYDSNGNGYVEEADLKRLQGQFLAIFGESPTSARATELAALWGAYWQGLLTMMDHAADGRISRQEWRDGHSRIVDDDASYHRLFTPAMTAVFRMMDTDADGKVGPAEWRNFQESIGNGDSAEVSFQQMDINHNGYLTVEELLDAFHEHLTSPDPNSRGGWFHGEV